MSRHETTFYFKSIVIALFAILILAYGLFELKGYLAGPELTNVTPESGAVLTESLVKISGDSRHLKRLTLNGRDIFLDESGHFEAETLLSYGYNIVTLRATDRFNTTLEKNIELFFK